jgi:hypothetical protein
LGVRTPGERGLTSASLIRARIEWSGQTIVREPTVAIGPAAVILAAVGDQVIPDILVARATRALVFPTIPG